MNCESPIQRSFELAAERCADLTPLVYERLFLEHPEAQKMFRSEGSDLVKGSMLVMAIEAILDFAGERQGHFRMIACEVLSHDAYGTPRDLFSASSASSPTRFASCSAPNGRRRWMRHGKNCWPIFRT